MCPLSSCFYGLFIVAISKHCNGCLIPSQGLSVFLMLSDCASAPDITSTHHPKHLVSHKHHHVVQGLHFQNIAKMSIYLITGLNKVMNITEKNLIKSQTTATKPKILQSCVV